MRKLIQLSGIFCIFLISCTSQRKIIYIQDKIKDSLHVVTQEKFIYRIQARDMLSIQVISHDSRISEFYNIRQPNSNQQMNLASNAYMNGYVVSDSGHVIIPVIGKVLLKNLTLAEARDYVEKIVRDQVKDATVILKLLNYRVTVLGEVRNPGLHYIYNEQFTLFEALGLAGDITDFGNRRNIKLLRQDQMGLQVVYIDLTDKHILNSPYFFLKPGDVLYVAPMKMKIDRNNLSQLTLVFASMSALLLLINFFKK
jgi:polysaccharide biosynthesis/export protein